MSTPIHIEPTDALLVVDVSKTFMPGGGLPVDNGDQVVAPMEQMIRAFLLAHATVVVVLDLHPRGHISLRSSYNEVDVTGRGDALAINHSPILTLEQVHRGEFVPAPHALFTHSELLEELEKLGGHFMNWWPDHALFGSPTGEEKLHPQLLGYNYTATLIKGMNPRIDSYSGFYDNRGNPTHLASLLRSRRVRRVFSGGLAYDFCVGFTSEDARKVGFDSYIVRDATRSVGIPASNNYPGSIVAMEQRLARAGVDEVSYRDIVTPTE